MQGFAQSLNLSVTAATTIYALREQALTADAPGNLTADEQKMWFEHWVSQLKGNKAKAILEQMDVEDLEDDPRATADVDRKGEPLDVYTADTPE